jgi:hypothetical protein
VAILFRRAQRYGAKVTERLIRENQRARSRPDKLGHRRAKLACASPEVAGAPNGEVIIHIDDQELPLAEFGRLLSVHAG